MNDPFFHAQAEKVARRILSQPDDNSRLDELFRIVLQRLPTKDERETMPRSFLTKYAGGDFRYAAGGPALGRCGRPVRESCFRATNSSTWNNIMHHVCNHGTRRQFVRSAVAGSLLMPGLLSELLAADAGVRRRLPTRTAPIRWLRNSRIFPPKPSR